MARAIDADALQELCNRRIQNTWNSGTAPVSWAEAYADFKDDIDSIPTLTPPKEPERVGLYGKYTVYKNKDGSLVTDCFVLRPTKDPAAVATLMAYAAATDNAELSADIINWVGAEPNEALTLEQLREMKDKPAYLNVFDPLLESGWHIIKAVTEDKIIFRGWQTVYVPIDGMGIDYNLYRRPPEEEED